MYQGLIKKYTKFLSVSDNTPVISLKEGKTQLIKAEKIGRDLGIELFLKFEGTNPTGSFKDRGMTMAVSKALEDNSKIIMCASTGNTSASAAAYAARAGIRCIVIIPDGNIAMGKLAQAMMYGAEVIAIEGNFDDALNIVKEITSNFPITLVNSINPYRIEGQKTGAYEIIDDLGICPDYHAIPVGNAGNITAYWQGYLDYFNHNISDKLPKMLGFQAEGAAPIVLGYPIKDPKTIATAIKIGNPASWQKAVNAVESSHGLIDKVSDAEITEAQKMLANKEGVFCEPASAASIAGLIKLKQQEKLETGKIYTAVLTGNGLKDPDRAIKISQEPKKLKADKNAILNLIGI